MTAPRCSKRRGLGDPTEENGRRSPQNRGRQQGQHKSFAEWSRAKPPRVQVACVRMGLNASTMWCRTKAKVVIWECLTWLDRWFPPKTVQTGKEKGKSDQEHDIHALVECRWSWPDLDSWRRESPPRRPCAPRTPGKAEIQPHLILRKGPKNSPKSLIRAELSHQRRGWQRGKGGGEEPKHPPHRRKQKRGFSGKEERGFQREGTSLSRTKGGLALTNTSFVNLL